MLFATLQLVELSKSLVIVVGDKPITNDKTRQ